MASITRCSSGSFVHIHSNVSIRDFTPEDCYQYFGIKIDSHPPRPDHLIHLFSKDSPFNFGKKINDQFALVYIPKLSLEMVYNLRQKYFKNGLDNDMEGVIFKLSKWVFDNYKDVETSGPLGRWVVISIESLVKSEGGIRDHNEEFAKQIHHLKNIGDANSLNLRPPALIELAFLTVALVKKYKLLPYTDYTYCDENKNHLKTSHIVIFGNHDYDPTVFPGVWNFVVQSSELLHRLKRVFSNSQSSTFKELTRGVIPVEKAPISVGMGVVIDEEV